MWDWGLTKVPNPPRTTTTETVVAGLEKRTRQHDRRLFGIGDGTIRQTITTTDDGATADLESGQALEVTWELPGSPSRNFLAGIKATVGSSSPSGTFQLQVNDDNYAASFTGGGDGFAAVSAMELASGGDAITITLVPTFAGGGEVSCSIACRAIG